MADEKIYLQWTLENWITVALMAFSALFVVGLISSGIRHYKGSANTGTNAGAEGY